LKCDYEILLNGLHHVANTIIQHGTFVLQLPSWSMAPYLECIIAALGLHQITVLTDI